MAQMDLSGRGMLALHVVGCGEQTPADSADDIQIRGAILINIPKLSTDQSIVRCL